MPARQGRILIVDDDADLRTTLRDLLAAQRFDVRAVGSGTAALDALREQTFDLLVTDLMMPEMDGIRLLQAAREIDANLVVILLTGQGTIASAVEAMRLGAFDYLLKPFKTSTLLPALERAMEHRRLRVENVQLKRIVGRLSFESPQYKLVGDGPEMKRVLHLIEKIAPTDSTVLIRGASGSGKELVARALHGNSPRRHKPLVTVNCAALQETLLESELFGHEKGSFTGAVSTKRGLIEEAEGGTLFIDEIGEMPVSMQAKLLRVLENHDFRRVGGTHEIHADVRVVAATNRALEEEQRAGRFREDLFYRLNVIAIPLPSLKERKPDIPSLIEHFLTTRPIGPRRQTVSSEAMAALVRHDWPGNVRELANVLERAQILAENAVITLDDLPEEVTNPATPPADDADENSLTLRAVERRHIVAVLARFKGNKLQAARALGVSRRALYRLIEKYRLAEAGDD